MNQEFSIIILTLNEEVHLPRLLCILQPLKARTYILDSGSTDQTADIARSYQAEFIHHTFISHPQQWDAALRLFRISTPWIICLDADQYPDPGLLQKLQKFKSTSYAGIDGIYFSRKNYFRGKWIKHGGYYPKYLLKMFRYNTGYSDLSETMDHRFQVPGKTKTWKKAHLIESNTKENRISFWIAKHNTYSDLLAEHGATRYKTGDPRIKANPFGHPNERNAWLKQLWQSLPLYFRPFIYFMYRYFFQLGFLDGKQGFIFHFLQAFWFRLLVDIKIEEHRHKFRKKDPAITFLYRFIMLFCLLYSFQIAFIGLSTPGGFYIPFLDEHLNYIRAWREFSINSTSQLLSSLGYHVTTRKNGLSVSGHSGFNLVYSCLGYGIMSCFAAFVLSYPKSNCSRFLFLATGLGTIQLLNLARFTLIALYYRPAAHYHHELYNLSIYVIIALSGYIWTSHAPSKQHNLRQSS